MPQNLYRKCSLNIFFNLLVKNSVLKTALSKLSFAMMSLSKQRRHDKSIYV